MAVRTKQLGALVVGLALAGCAQNGPSVAGAAGGQTSVNADASLQRCPETLGTLAIDDSRREAWWGTFYQNTQIANLEPMIRLMVEQSNCFAITSIGNRDIDAQIGRITREQRNGEFRAGSHQQRGQRVAADYFLQPTIVFSSGGAASLLANLPIGSTFVHAASLYREKTAEVSLSLFDIRAGVQAAAAEGSGTASNFGAMAASFHSGGAGALSAYSSSPAGRATLTGFANAYNKLVIAVKNYKAQKVRGGLGTGGRLKVQGQ